MQFVNWNCKVKSQGSGYDYKKKPAAEESQHYKAFVIWDNKSPE